MIRQCKRLQFTTRTFDKLLGRSFGSGKPWGTSQQSYFRRDHFDSVSKFCWQCEKCRPRTRAYHTLISYVVLGFRFKEAYNLRPFRSLDFIYDLSTIERETTHLSTCPPQADSMLLQNFSYHQFLPMPRSMMDLLGTYPYHTLVALLFGCMTLSSQLKKDKNRNPNGLPLPPGPKGYPLIGSLFDFPFNRSWLVYDEWTKSYGTYFMIDFHRGHHLITSHFRWYDILQCPWPGLLNFGLPATDHRCVWKKIFKLLGQDATTHVKIVCIRSLSRRWISDLYRMGFDFLMALLPYGVRWRKLRRMIYEHFHVNALYKHLPTQRREVHAFLHRLLATPDNFFLHIRQ